MALDTQDKRASSISRLPLMRVLPLADGSVDAPDRMHTVGVYSGIAAGAPPSGSPWWYYHLAKQRRGY
jgi:hypothetical protein